MDKLEQKIPWLTPPWWHPPAIQILDSTDKAKGQHDRILQKENERLIFYTDGSGVNGKVGASAVLHGSSLVQAYMGAETISTVYTAELKGIHMALEMAIHLTNQLSGKREVVLFSDSQAALQAILRVNPNPNPLTHPTRDAALRAPSPSLIPHLHSYILPSPLLLTLTLTLALSLSLSLPSNPHPLTLLFSSTLTLIPSSPSPSLSTFILLLISLSILLLLLSSCFYVFSPLSSALLFLVFLLPSLLSLPFLLVSSFSLSLPYSLSLSPSSSFSFLSFSLLPSLFSSFSLFSVFPSYFPFLSL